MDIKRFQEQLSNSASDDRARVLPPVEKWNPGFCGDINMEIQRDGRWFYENSPIGRQSLVKLFSSVLKMEKDNYFLVTPVEKVGIRVVDVPFVITQWEAIDGYLYFTTQTDDRFVVSTEHPVCLRPDPKDSENLIPYVNVRRNLWARLHQNVYYQLVDKAVEELHPNGTTRLLLISGNYSFSIGHYANL